MWCVCVVAMVTVPPSMGEKAERSQKSDKI
jgi:hypothetical protein